MDDLSLTRVWGMRALFLGLCALVMFFHLLPLDTGSQSWAGPNVIVLLCFAWVMRRPDYAPVLSVAGVMFLGDLLLQRPPGLLALLVLMGSEHLKTRARRLRAASFLSEWGIVSAVLIAIALMNRAVLAILLVDQAPFSLSLIDLIMTVLCYPLIVALTHFGFGVRKTAPGALGPQEIRL